MEQLTKKIVTEDGVTDTTNYTYSGMSILFTKDGNGDKLTENILASDGLTIASGLLGRAVNSAEFTTSPKV